MGFNSQQTRRVCFSSAFLILGLFSFNSAYADANGRVGYSGMTGTNCTVCHTQVANVPTVSLTGPASALVAPGSTSSFTFTMLGGPGTTAAGMNIAADGGTLVDTNAAGTQMAAGEITHSSPLSMPGGLISWTFDWTAPATPGNYTIYAAGLSGDADGNETGDGTAVTSFLVVVSAITTPQDPVAVISGPSTGTTGTVINFSGGGSTDADGTIVDYSWDFGDGTAGTGADVSHTFAAGAYTVTLTVTDDSGASNSTTLNIVISDTNVAQPPIADAAGPYAADAGVDIQFDGSASMDPDGTITSYSWDFGDGGTATGANPVYAYPIAGNFTITLTVVDNDGMLGTVTTTATIADVSPPPAPTPLPAAGTGEELYIMHCESCHGPNGSGGPDGSVVGEDAGDIIEAIMEEPTMNYLMDVLRRSEIDQIGEFLDMKEEDDDDDDEEEEDDDERSVTLGETLYDTFCASCHGDDGNGAAASAVVGTSIDDLNAAVAQEPTMQIQVDALSDAYIDQIVSYLNRSSASNNGGGGGGAMYWAGLLIPGIWLVRRYRRRRES